MILIDGLYVNNGGGRVLLDYLIEELEKKDQQVIYLLDQRISHHPPRIKASNSVIYMKSSLINRFCYYFRNRNKFKKILCFGNIPPLIRLDAVVYTYFHQKLFLEIPKEIPFKDKIIYQIKALVFNLLLKNTDFCIVQTQTMKNSLLKKIPRIGNGKVLIIPFYPSIKNTCIEGRAKDSFVYVSSGAKYKNHFNLIEAFCSFYDVKKRGELHLTIDKDFNDLSSIIEIRIKEGYPIINHGFVPRAELGIIYGKASFLIYPSLSESFGLGIVEAIENGCRIIGADLPYTYSVCKPSLVFDPNEIGSIANSFKLALTEEINATEQLVFNEIDNLLALLK
jgi:glycosyltransferase involved in cell wall biosynthesis